MTQKLNLTWDEVYDRAHEIVKDIQRWMNHGGIWEGPFHIYGIPRGGIHAMQAVIAQSPPELREQLEIVDTISNADYIIDDLVDSGDTRRKALAMNPNAAFGSLCVKHKESLGGIWVVFPWERNVPKGEANESEGPTDAITRILEFIGEDPNREGLRETPTRVLKSYAEIFAGYRQTAEEHMKVFEDGACDEMVVVKDIEFFSCCEHHMQPFFGKAHIAYIPREKVIGVSKLARILDVYARRLQIQERLTTQVTDALMTHLLPKGAACVIEAKHFCMVCRGVQKQNSIMVTSSMRGVFRENPAARSELLSILGK